jgi:uncharacterized protein
MAEFIYILTLEPRLIEDENWTNEDKQAGKEHFAYLEGLLAEGRLAFAGRTTVKYPMGIVVFEAEDMEAAQKIAENDPAVVKGIMTARISSFRIALMRG